MVGKLGDLALRTRLLLALPFDPGRLLPHRDRTSEALTERPECHFNMEGKRGPARHSLKIRSEVIVAGAGRRRGWPLWHDLQRSGALGFVEPDLGFQRSCILLREEP